MRGAENPATAFERVIDDLAAASDDGQMVVLIDEYDKPLLNHLMKPDVTRDIFVFDSVFLKEKYGTIRSHGERWVVPLKMENQWVVFAVS